MKIILLALGIIIAPAASFSHEFKLGDLVVDHPIARATTATAMTSAGYFMITNNGTADDTLLGVEADFPRVTIHDTTVENGVATMSHIEGGVVIPAGESVLFEPGGKHVMFMGLNGDPFEIGEEIAGELQFEKAGKVAIYFKVDDISAAHNH